MTRRPRFIAGAICPSCGEIDRTVLEIGESVRERRCVACGHREVQADGAAPTPPARFDSGRAKASDAPITRIRLPKARASDPDPEPHE